MLIESFFAELKKREAFKSVSVEKWLNKLQHVHTGEFSRCLKILCSVNNSNVSYGKDFYPYH